MTDPVHNFAATLGRPRDAEAEDLGARPGPHPIDRHVGLRIRMRRKELGLSQEKLAQALGLTFQQVQKYERGANRVSASKLWEIARALRVPVTYFYEGLSSSSKDRPAPMNPAHAFLLSNEGLELAATFPKISRDHLRRKVLELVRAMSEPDAELRPTAAAAE